MSLPDVAISFSPLERSKGEKSFLGHEMLLPKLLLISSALILYGNVLMRKWAVLDIGY
jgi:hypothetical protein